MEEMVKVVKKGFYSMRLFTESLKVDQYTYVKKKFTGNVHLGSLESS